MGETVNPAALEATETQFDSEMPDMAYKVETPVWAVTRIRLNGVTIPRGSWGVVVGVKGRFKTEYTVMWQRYPKIRTTVAAKYVITN